MAFAVRGRNMSEAQPLGTADHKRIDELFVQLLVSDETCFPSGAAPIGTLTYRRNHIAPLVFRSEISLHKFRMPLARDAVALSELTPAGWTAVRHSVSLRSQALIPYGWLFILNFCYHAGGRRQCRLQRELCSCRIAMSLDMVQTRFCIGCRLQFYDVLQQSTPPLFCGRLHQVLDQVVHFLSRVEIS